MMTYVKAFRQKFFTDLLECRVQFSGDVEIGTLAMPELRSVVTTENT